jgi:hypothetical protein
MGRRQRDRLSFAQDSSGGLNARRADAAGATPLAQDDVEEAAVAEDIPPPQAMGFADKTAKPFEADVSHPHWRAFAETGHCIDGSAHAMDDADGQVAVVLVDPTLLLGRAEGDDEEVGLGLYDPVADASVGRRIGFEVERWAVDADGAQSGIAFGEAIGVIQAAPGTAPTI